MKGFNNDKEKTHRRIQTGGSSPSSISRRAISIWIVRSCEKLWDRGFGQYLPVSLDTEKEGLPRGLWEKSTTLAKDQAILVRYVSACTS